MIGLKRMHNHFLTVLLGVALLTGIGTVDADMVILKSGEMFPTPKAWRDNGTVNYYQDGQVVRVDETAVERLIHSPATIEDQPPPVQRPADVSPSLPPHDLPPPTGDMCGYLDLKWGQPVSQIEGLALVGVDPAYGGVQQYALAQRQKRFGRARVDNIFYGFWQGGLYTLLVETSNFIDFMDLKAEAFRRYGEGSQVSDHEEKYRWTGKGADRLLAYDFDSDTGYLWMRSQVLHEKVKVRYPN
jgi:hypothetical protein